MRIKLFNRKTGFSLEMHPTPKTSITELVAICGGPAELLQNMDDNGMGVHTKTVGDWTLTLTDNVHAPVRSL